MSKKFGFRPLLLLASPLVLPGLTEVRAAALWSTAYYAGWMQRHLPPSAIGSTGRDRHCERDGAERLRVDGLQQQDRLAHDHRHDRHGERER